MAATPEYLHQIDVLLEAAAARFAANPERSPLSGPALEGLSIINGPAAALIDGLLKAPQNDPVAFVEYVQKADAVWTNYVRAANVYGMGEGTVGFEALSGRHWA